MSFRYLLKSIKLVPYCYRILIANISIGKWRLFVTCGFDSLFLISAHAKAYLNRDDFVIGIYSFKRGVYRTVPSAIYSLLVYDYIIELRFGVI